MRALQISATTNTLSDKAASMLFLFHQVRLLFTVLSCEII